ncbi:MAG: DUF362 domain-containing protein [Candidatus Bipolaricaulota bacterium]|nr:DUF362 domain-containing protein [Candidatus Bipolaricaulota bacterium]
MEVLAQLRPKRLLLGEGSGEDTPHLGCLSWAETFGAEVLDLNADERVRREIHDAQRHPIPVRVARTALEIFRVPSALPKTHDYVIVTLGIRDLVRGAIPKPDRPEVHQEHPAMNRNLALLARELAPQLA